MNDEKVWNIAFKGSDWHKECPEKTEESVEVLEDEKYYVQDDFAHHTEIWKNDDTLTLENLLHWILQAHPFHEIMTGMTKKRVVNKGIIFMNKFMEKFPAKNGIETKLDSLGNRALHKCLRHFALYTEKEKLEVKKVLIDEVLEYCKDL